MAQMGQQYQTAQQYQYPQQYQQSQNNSQYAAAQHYQQQQQQYSYAASQQNPQQYPQGYQQQNYQQYQPQQYNTHPQNQQYSQQYPNQHSQQYAQQYSQQYPQQYQQYTEQSQQYPQQAQQYPQQAQQYPQPTQQYPQQSQQYSQPQQQQQQQYSQHSQQHQQYSSQQQSPQYSQYSQYPQQQQGNTPNHSTTQDQSYAHPYQAQNQQNFVPPALPGQETCYNCGAPNHMAQNCPEPRREVPAGLIKRQKRQHYPKNQHSYNAAMNASGSQPQAYNQSAFAQNQSYSPATPNSARSSFSQQWQSGPYQQQVHVQQQNQQPFQQDQQTVQQSPYQSQSSPHNFPSYSTPVTPGTNTQFDPIHNNQMAAQQGQHSNASGPAYSAHHSSMPPAESQPDAILDGQNPQVETEDDSAGVDDEPEEDDLTSLDVPDLPRTTEQYGEAVIRPVGRALPSNSIVADAISPLPAPDIDGRCQSKYYENVGKILEMQEIRVSPYWKDVQDDTIFRPIVDEGKIRSVDECLEKVQQRLRPQSEEEILHKSRSESRSLAPRSAEAIEMAESLETLERALAEAKAKQAEMIRNRKKMKQRRVSDAQHNQSEIAAKSPMVKKEHQSPPFSASPSESAVESRSTEDVLASLGVTGASKPGTAVAGRGNQRPLSTMSPHYPKQQSQQLQGMNGHAKGSPPSKPYAQQFPMAQEIQTPTYSDGSNVHSPDSSRRLYTNGTNGNGPYPYSVEESTMSPTQYQSERSQSHKRSYEQREESSSSEEGSSPRRQEDDILPKHKKRQPQVAAAYSRRW